jgi:hypothetical protein
MKETSITLDQKVTNPEGRDLSFNFELVSRLIITSKPNGDVIVTFKVDDELADAYVMYLNASLGQS